MAEVEVAEDSARRLAEEHGLRFVDLTQAALAPGAAALLPEEVARRHRVVPIGRRLGTPVIAVSDPGDLFAMDALRASVGREFVAVVAREDQVVRALGTLYSQVEAPFPEEDDDAAPGGSPDATDQATVEGPRTVPTVPGPPPAAARVASAPGGPPVVPMASAPPVVPMASAPGAPPVAPPLAGPRSPVAEPAIVREVVNSVRAPDTTVTRDPEVSHPAVPVVADQPSGMVADKGAVVVEADPVAKSADPATPGSEATVVSVVESPVVESPVVESPVATAPVATAPVATAPVVTPPVVTAPVVTAPVVTAPVVTAPVVTAPVVTAPVVTAPVVESPVAESPVVESAATSPVVESPVATPPAEAATRPEATDPEDADAPAAATEGRPAIDEVVGSSERSAPGVATLPGEGGAIAPEGGSPDTNEAAVTDVPTPDSEPVGPEVNGNHPAGTDLGGPPIPPVGFVSAGGPAEIVFHPPSDPDDLDAPAIDREGDGDVPPAPDGYGLIDIEAPEPSSDFEGPLLAKVLVDSGRVTPEQMMAALTAHQQTGESLARYLFNQSLATEDDLVWAMAQEVGLEFVDLNAVTVDRVAAALIPEATARHHMVLPIRVENGVPVVAMANPTDVFAMDDLRTIMGRNFTPVVATRSQIAHFLRFSHESEVDVSEVATDAEAGAFGGSQFELESLQAVVEDAPIVRYVNLLILQALNERASDIHIEPTPRRLRIRFRIDGVMHDATSASSSIASAVVSRLKVLGEMDITEHRIPQEGRVSLSVSDRQIDLRLAVLPSIYGETVVMRLLDKSASIRTLPELGFSADTLGRYAKAYHQPYGVILVTGPTGAGKTTTLYATLAEVTSSERSVVTVEDPVEYQIDGITQVQINPKAGLMFSNALKSILRSDPDIVLIGEIRDADTAMIAMEAALSGHLVLTTLHTNTAAATPLRLTEMGIEPFLVTSALGSVLTQRLARVLCPNCKETYDSTEQDFFAAGYTEADLELVESTTLHRAVGCRNCGHTGYQGRMVLSEVMNMSEEIDRMIIGQSSIVDIERKACEQGMRTLRQDGLIKAVSGMTTLEEVLRVVV